MFEKEAEEYIKKDGTKTEKLLNSVKLSLTREEATVLINAIKQSYIDGAEFGYNKANEWHFVKDEGTPKVEGHYLVCLRNKDKDIFDCWIYYDKDVGWYSMKVRMKDIYAWKEIILPELKESE